MNEKIESALNEIRPMLARHLGNVEFVSFDEGIVKVRFLGTCQGCPLSTLTLKAGIESVLREKVPEVQAVETV
ncbi:MAG: NifU family protein [bacterium]|nr:NifU family protein [bacterium]